MSFNWQRALILTKSKIIFLFIKQLFTVFFLCSLVACASTEEGQAEESMDSGSAGSDCISQGSIRDYTVLDYSNLIVTQSGGRKFHVKLSRESRGLKSSNAIGLYSPTGRICSRFGEVVTDEGFGPQKNLVASVRRLSPQSEEELLIRFGKIEPKYKQPRPPEKVEGAEVEELD